MKGFLDLFSSKDYPKMSDREVGIDVLSYFYKYSRTYLRDGGEQWNLDDLIDYFDRQRGNQIGGLGLGIKLAETDEGQVEDAMEKLALKSQGEIPNSMAVFREFVAGRMMEVQLMSPRFLKEVVGESVLQIGKGVAQVGQSVIDVGSGVVSWSKYSFYILPVIGVAGLGIVYYLYGGKIKAIMGLAGKRGK